MQCIVISCSPGCMHMHHGHKNRYKTPALSKYTQREQTRLPPAQLAPNTPLSRCTRIEVPRMLLALPCTASPIIYNRLYFTILADTSNGTYHDCQFFAETRVRSGQGTAESSDVTSTHLHDTFLTCDASTTAAQRSAQTGPSDNSQAVTLLQ